MALLDGSRPHLRVHNDTSEIPIASLSGVPYRVEVVYSNGMHARVHGAEGVSQVGEMYTQMLLRVVDEATGTAERN